MTEKEFPTLIVASTITGIALCQIKGGLGPMLECAAHLLGGPVWNHEFCHEPTMMEISEAAYSQFPDLPTRAEAEADYQAAAAKALAAYGPVVSVKEGTFRRRESPLATLRTVAPHAEIITIHPKGDEQ